LNNWQTYVFLGIPLLLYLCQAFAVYFAQGRYGMCMALTAYAIANCGLILDALGV
jgi:hypothetical protein